MWFGQAMSGRTYQIPFHTILLSFYTLRTLDLQRLYYDYLTVINSLNATIFLCLVCILHRFMLATVQLVYRNHMI